MLTIYDLKTIIKLCPKCGEKLASGQYYFNVVPYDHEDIKFWKFSMSGPGPNGPAIMRVLVEDDDPVVKQYGIHYVINTIYEDLVTRYWNIDIVARTIT